MHIIDALSNRACQDDDMEKQKRLQELEASLQAAQKQMEDLHSMVEAERAKSASTDIILAETVLTLDQVGTCSNPCHRSSTAP